MFGQLAHPLGVELVVDIFENLRLIGNGQAPVHKYWEEILYDYIIPGKFDPTLFVLPFLTLC